MNFKLSYSLLLATILSVALFSSCSETDPIFQTELKNTSAISSSSDNNENFATNENSINELHMTADIAEITDNELNWFLNNNSSDENQGICCAPFYKQHGYIGSSPYVMFSGYSYSKPETKQYFVQAAAFRYNADGIPVLFQLTDKKPELQSKPTCKEDTQTAWRIFIDDSDICAYEPILVSYVRGFYDLKGNPEFCGGTKLNINLKSCKFLSWEKCCFELGPNDDDGGL